ncbi:replicase polyprotein [Hydrangea chlorotic mottle virus]|uniref:Replicase polyprotein n=1 Tax=Hydrangea chlorotic mottle virus TaxID=375546 RepID=B3VKH1_9VIRU|nr:replicase polyprotein [Hydrangea chlorotic mottle virus]ACE78181.2 replicase polyprotein [Hydrangea chlorotic mottle virus]
MALTYRSPVEEVLTLLEPASQSLIANTATTSYQKAEKENFSWFNYSLPAIAKEHLSRAGIYLSPFSGYPHSHPVCKTLENYLLYRVLPDIINNTFYFVGIKGFKLNFLKKRFDKLSLVSAINRYVSSADKIRYGNEFVVRASSESRLLKRHCGLFDSPTLRDLVPNVKTGSNLFMHDELHYWSKNDLIAFLEICKPEVLLGTLVYPPEIFVGASYSLNPWCYEFEVRNNKLFYYPDGVRSEGYEQPLEGGFLLQTSKIRLADGVVYCVDLICSKFSHHMVSITRGELVVPTYRSFGPFEAIKSDGLKDISRGEVCFFPISHPMLLRVYRYLRSLKKPDKQSAMAKFSQLNHDPSGLAVKFMEEFSDLVISTGSIRSMLNAEHVKLFFANLGRKLPSVLSAKIKATRMVCLDDFIANLKPLCVDVKLREIQRSSKFDFKFFHEEEIEDDFDLEESIELSWRGCGVLDRVSMPYVGTSTHREQCVTWDGDFNKAALLRKLKDLYVHAFCGETHTALIDVASYVALLRGKCNLLASTVLASLSQADLFRVHNHVRNTHHILFGWHGERVKWFLRPNNQKAYMRYLGSNVPLGCTHHMEMVTHGFMGKRRPVRYNWLNTCGEDTVERSVLYEPVVVRESVAPQGTMHEEVAAATDRDVLKRPTDLCTVQCACGLSMAVRSVPYADLRQDYYPDKLKNRQCAWYSVGEVNYKYNGGDHVSRGWPEWLTLWMQVNEIPDKYDCMLAQKYEEGAQIGFHADDEGIFESGESILTVNVMGSACFKIKCGAGCSAFELTDAIQFTMPENFQCTHKHAVEVKSAGRISFTFRVLRKQDVTVKAAHALNEQLGHTTIMCGVTIAVEPCQKFSSISYDVIRNRGGGDCFWLAMEYYTGVNVQTAKAGLLNVEWDEDYKPRLLKQLLDKAWAEDEAISAACKHFGFNIVVYDIPQNCRLRYSTSANKRTAMLKLDAGHSRRLEPVELCTIRAISQAVKRTDKDVLVVLLQSLGDNFEKELLEGKGVQMDMFLQMLEVFDIAGMVESQAGTHLYNAQGAIKCNFKCSGNHIEYVKDKMFSSLEHFNVSDGNLGVEEEKLSSLYEKSNAIEYYPDIARAKILADSLHEGTTGVLCSELYNGAGNLLDSAKVDESKKVVHAFIGTFGCGKSRLFTELLERMRGKALCYVSPRRALCGIFEEVIQRTVKTIGKSGAQHFKCYTFEKFLKRLNKLTADAVVVLDEIQLYPPGFLDLVLLLLSVKTRLFVLGDPCQSDYDSEKDRAILGPLQPDIKRLLEGRTYRYNISSYRFQSAVFEGRLPCAFASDLDQSVRKLKLLEGLDAIDARANYAKVALVSSFDEKKIVQAYFGSECQCLTFGESTGLTFQEGCIMVSDLSARTNEQRWLTALSRFRRNVVLINATSTNWHVIEKQYQKRALGRFLSRSAKQEDLLELLPGEPIFTKGFEGEHYGADEGKREDKLAGDPWLKTMIDLLQVEDMMEVEMIQEIVENVWFRTHLPQCELESVRASWVHRILAKEFREKRMGYLVSEQFTDEHSKQPGKILTNAAERFETIYPRHRASDTVTFIMAVRKRLRFSSPMKESAKLSQAMPYGPFLLREFLKRVPLKPMHNKDMMAQAKFEFEEKKTSKSAATIENHSNRSCKDWLADVGMVFSKSQLCTKFDNRFRDAKAAQTIVCFQHSVLCRFAPYMRYIEKKLHEVLPEKYYIHSGKGLEELNSWVQIGRFDSLCTESDYEAFDASQDQYIMAFEICLMRYLGLPNDLIEDYTYIKTHLGSKLGNFSIMRFSGEASTFLFNTMANMLFTFLQYDIKGDERICFAGDDMCSNKKLHKSEKHEGFLGKLKLKAKVCHTSSPTFCGWNLSPDGIFKKPQLVLERMCIAKETNNLANCIDNYAIEVSYAYLMGERAKERMSEEEVDAFYNCVRIIIKNKHLLKSDVRHVYETNIDL